MFHFKMTSQMCNTPVLYLLNSIFRHLSSYLLIISSCCKSIFKSSRIHIPHSYLKERLYLSKHRCCLSFYIIALILFWDWKGCLLNFLLFYQSLSRRTDHRTLRRIIGWSRMSREEREILIIEASRVLYFFKEV